MSWIVRADSRVVQPRPGVPEGGWFKYYTERVVGRTDAELHGARLDLNKTITMHEQSGNRDPHEPYMEKLLAERDAVMTEMQKRQGLSTQGASGWTRRQPSHVKFDQTARVEVLVTTEDIEEHSEEIQKLRDEYDDKAGAIRNAERADPQKDKYGEVVNLKKYEDQVDALRDEYITKAQAIENRVVISVAYSLIESDENKVGISVELSSPTGSIDWSEIFT